MAQLFSRGATTRFRVILALFAALIIGLFFSGELQRAVLIWDNDVHLEQPMLFGKQPRERPLQFSHKHHVGDDGIDCRYCHTSVETSPFAGLPPTETCLNCHRQIWLASEMLAPVHSSALSRETMHWTRVYDLPDFVYFDHSIHIAKGVGCSTCHGRVDQMPVTRAVEPLVMHWCVSCHRHPEQALRPKSEIFNMEWQPPANQEVIGRELRAAYGIQDTALLTSCSTCHR
jgi:hypothetical protein